MMAQEWDVLREVSLLDDHPADSDTERRPLSASQVAITWRGDAKYFATLVQWPAPGSSSGQGLSDTTQPSSAASASGTEGSVPSPNVQSIGHDSAGAAAVATTSLCIWRRDGCELHARGEAVAQLLPVAAWQPNGRHLYVGQAAPDGPRVLLFETNGLQHGSFSLRSTTGARKHGNFCISAHDP